MSQPANLLELALDLTRCLKAADRYDRMLGALRKVIQCDATALLERRGELLKPIAIQGLSKDTLGRRFTIGEHPRLEEICQSAKPHIFPRECPLPDPYDGLLLAQTGNVPVHACMGLPLYDEHTLIGALTFDSLTPSAFDDQDLRQLTLIADLVAAALKTAFRIEEMERATQQSNALAQELNRESLVRDGAELIGDSQGMQRLKAEIDLVAGSDFSVLIQGETGVGKELVARNLHLRSSRADKPFIHLNCASLPEGLAESEFFGHSKGAFTGAERARPGKFQLADGGTLFLDEIGELPLTLQSKLLRALQSGEIQPVGEDEVRHVDVRILAATNRDLAQEVEEGRFRADLYHRLSVFPLYVPPLRERGDDAVLLAGYFAGQTARKLGITQLRLSEQLSYQLSHYAWPGNVRELEHTVRRAALRAKQEQWPSPIVSMYPEHAGLVDSHAPSAQIKTEIAAPDDENRVSLKQATDEFQASLIRRQLGACDHNWAAAARALNTDRANLVRLAKRLGIRVEKRLHAPPRR